MLAPMLITFDLGGVLVRICRNWQEGCLAADVEIRAFEETDDHVARRNALINSAHVGDIRTDAFIRGMHEVFERTWNEDEIRRVHDAWVTGPYADTLTLIEDIHAAGHATACLSNTDESHWESLIRNETIAALGHRHASHLLGLRKPNPAIWTAFEELVKRPAEDIVFFDDLTENVTSARMAGWDVHQIDHESETVPQIRNALQQRGLL